MLPRGYNVKDAGEASFSLDSRGRFSWYPGDAPGEALHEHIPDMDHLYDLGNDEFALSAKTRWSG